MDELGYAQTARPTPTDRAHTRGQAGARDRGRRLRAPRARCAALPGCQRPVSRWWLQDQVAKYCKLAGVPQVPPHVLRGSLASLLYSADAAPQLVAAVLGHASPGVTEAHYADRAAVKGAEIRRRLGVLDGKR